ncbi:hypothetical protein [Nonomuraea angiospora]|uniref:hypothetical protein n=1 Tax=Nonomuraea angiospora TaxID=46172 RepID=UPI0029AD395A|nr:hypothetical protein [Nonomuraea angiospora]MDX3100479.1 hypothetical protein [Nonomuraea angiospora]
MGSFNDFASRVDSVKEELRLDGKFNGFSDEEWAFVEEVLMSDKADVFIGLLGKAREYGVCDGIEEGRLESFASGY